MAEIDDITAAMGGLDPLDGPQPGESLVANPDEALPFEEPPVFTNQDEALEELFMNLTDEDNMDDMLNLMRAEVPLEDIAQVILFGGFREGMYSPDLMLTMIEPTIYILIFLADYAGINPVLAPEDEFGFADEAGEAEEFADIQQPESVPQTLLTTIQSKLGGEQ